MYLPLKYGLLRLAKATLVSARRFRSWCSPISLIFPRQAVPQRCNTALAHACSLSSSSDGWNMFAPCIPTLALLHTSTLLYCSVRDDRVVTTILTKEAKLVPRCIPREGITFFLVLSPSYSATTTCCHCHQNHGATRKSCRVGIGPVDHQ